MTLDEILSQVAGGFNLQALSLESVFGVLFSVLFYGDPVTPRLLLGFGLIFIAVLCSETKFSFLRPKQQVSL